MNEINPVDEMEFTEDMFKSALERLRRKHSSKYKFILKGGLSYHQALYTLMKFVWETEEIPALWKQTDIIQLFKGKGSSSDLSNYRNIHTKTETRKLFGEIVTHEVKLKIEGQVSKFQIGALSGHRAQEHLFTIKSVISFYMSMGKGLILSLYDISKYFDKENLKDCMGELHKHGVRGKVYRLVYNLNKENNIRIKTAVGYTDYTEVGENVGQGTNEGAIVSTVNLAGGVTEQFEDSETEVQYENIKLGPCLFQDDVARLATDIDSVVDGNKRIEKWLRESY